MEIGKFEDDTVINVIYHEGEKGWTMVKRFKIETTTQDQKFVFCLIHKALSCIWRPWTKTCGYLFLQIRKSDRRKGSCGG